jgi:hypothetical protein
LNKRFEELVNLIPFHPDLLWQKLTSSIALSIWFWNSGRGDHCSPNDFSEQNPKIDPQLRDKEGKRADDPLG